MRPLSVNEIIVEEICQQLAGLKCALPKFFTMWVNKYLEIMNRTYTWHDCSYVLTEREVARTMIYLAFLIENDNHLHISKQAKPMFSEPQLDLMKLWPDCFRVELRSIVDGKSDSRIVMGVGDILAHYCLESMMRICEFFKGIGDRDVKKFSQYFERVQNHVYEYDSYSYVHIQSLLDKWCHDFHKNDRMVWLCDNFPRKAPEDEEREIRNRRIECAYASYLI
jgi:hypothetical protein